MNCKRARLHVALLMGDDLDEAAQSELRAHLRECAPCREYHAGMAAAPHPIQEFEERAVFELHDSLWPGLLDKLPPRPGLRVHDFNGWWAALAVAVAFVAIGLFWHDEARSGRWSSPVTAENSPERLGDIPQLPVIGLGDSQGALKTIPGPPSNRGPRRNRRQLFVVPDERTGGFRLYLAPLRHGFPSSDFFEENRAPSLQDESAQ